MTSGLLTRRGTADRLTTYILHFVSDFHLVWFCLEPLFSQLASLLRCQRRAVYYTAAGRSAQVRGQLCLLQQLLSKAIITQVEPGALFPLDLSVRMRQVTSHLICNVVIIMLMFLLCCSQSLTSSQPHTRARGVQLLSEVLGDCYDVFTEAEREHPFDLFNKLFFMEHILFQYFCLFFYAVKVLIAFYENRLKDHYVVTSPVLQGLRALVSLYMLDFQCQGCPPQKKHWIVFVW